MLAVTNGSASLPSFSPGWKREASSPVAVRGVGDRGWLHPQAHLGTRSPVSPHLLGLLSGAGLDLVWESQWCDKTGNKCSRQQIIFYKLCSRSVSCERWRWFLTLGFGRQRKLSELWRHLRSWISPVLVLVVYTWLLPWKWMASLLQWWESISWLSPTGESMGPRSCVISDFAGFCYY